MTITIAATSMLVLRRRFWTYPNSFLAVCEEAGTYGTVDAMPIDVSRGGWAKGRMGTALDGRGIGGEWYELLVSETAGEGFSSICMELESRWLKVRSLP